MSGSSRLQRLGRQMLYGGGVLSALAAALGAVLVGQAALVSRAIPRGILRVPDSTGRFGAHYPGTPVTFAMLGDSAAAGVGVELPAQTPGALLAAALADALQRPVDLICLARNGAQSQHLHPQVDAAIAARPAITTIIIGGNDVVHRVPTGTAVRHLEHTVRRLRAAGSEVVVATCPDMGSMEAVRPPLRWLVRRWCRDMASAQTVAVVSAGGRTISLDGALATEFGARPHELYAIDQFHPSARGYLLAAELILPSMLAALGKRPEPASTRQADRWSSASVPRQGVRSLRHAASEAARTAGTEVAPVDAVSGSDGAAEGGDGADSAGRTSRKLWGDLRNRLAWLRG